MFEKIEGGTCEVLYEHYKCWIPPVGKGVREIRLPDKSHRYEVGDADIIKRSSNPKEQYWERTPMPKGYAERLENEERQQETNPDFIDNELESYRQQEWNRRLYGVWVWIRGKQVYLTGLHYFYLQWWYIDGGYPQYRDIDRRVFYVLQYCMEDPNCLGMLEVTSRRSGKTYRSGCWMYERISRNKQANGGIQSKTDDDGKKMYLKSIMTPWTKLPAFFRPVYNISKGDKPESGLFFFKQSQRGSKAFSDDGKPQLESQVTYKDSKPFSYDGDALYCYISDEYGKLTLHDIVERHDVVKPCSQQQGLFIGKHYYTSTVEDADSGGKNAKRMWDNSNPTERNENNETESGLYRIFTPASEYEGRFDVYGFTDVGANKTRILATRATKKSQKELYGIIRKFPLSIEEAFRFTGAGQSIFDKDVLYDRIDALELYTGAERGNYIWKDGIPFSEVIWVPHRDGRWERYWDFPKTDGNYRVHRPNEVIKRGEKVWIPGNKNNFIAGCDPFSHGNIQDESRGSLAGAFVKMKFDPGSDDPFNDAVVCMYHSRPSTVSIFHEDMLKMAWYYGCEILFENNKNNWDDYFKNAGCDAFTMQLPEYNGKGCPGNDKTAERFVDLIEEHIATSIHKLYSKRLLNQLIEFDFNNRTKYDLVMAFGYTLIGDHKRQFRKTDNSSIELGSLIRKHKINAA